MGLALWTSKHRATRSKSSISSISRTPTSPSSVPDGFGIPAADDPDPFGVRALELAGLRIKEAGTDRRPSVDTFDFRPSPTSPAFRLSAQSIDAAALRDVRRESKRDSRRSCLSVDHGTQTADLPSPTIDERELCRSPPLIEEEPLQESLEQLPTEEQHTEIPVQSSSEDVAVGPDHNQDAEDELEIDEEPEIVVEQAKPSFQGLTRAQASPIETKPRIVNITKRAPPALPIKSPLRQRAFQAVEPAIESDLTEEDFKDDSSSTYSSSPTKSSFDKNEYSPTPWSAQTSVQDTESLQHKDEYLPDLDVPPLYDEDDGSSLADSETTHHDAMHHPEQRTVPYSMGDLINTSGETLAISVQAGDDHKLRKESVDSVAHVSQQSITHLIPEAPIHSSADISETASVSSFYEEDEEPAPEKEAFHSTSSLPLASPLEQISTAEATA